MKFKRFGIYALCACLLLSTVLFFSSCGSSSDALKNEGLEVISLMNEMIISEDYAEMLLGNVSAYEETIVKVKGGNYSEPKGVYEIEVSPDLILKEYNEDSAELSNALKKYLSTAAFASFAATINSRNGSNSVALSAVYAASNYFVDKNITDGHIYLYCFENGYPIIVSFVPRSDGIVQATGNLIIDDGIGTSNAESIEDYLIKFGFSDITVTEK